MSTISKIFFIILFIISAFVALKLVSKAYINLNLLDQEDNSED